MCRTKMNNLTCYLRKQIYRNLKRENICLLVKNYKDFKNYLDVRVSWYPKVFEIFLQKRIKKMRGVVT